MWLGSEECKFCGTEENIDHLIFHCPMYVYLWNVVKDGLGWVSFPKFVVDFTENYLLESGEKGNQILIFLFGAISWTLWLTRNDCVFNDKLFSSPTSVIFKLISYATVEDHQLGRGQICSGEAY
jgi:hypothetical protein